MSPSFSPAISSMSLGRAWNHAFIQKMLCASRHGFRGIEIFYEDLEYLARSFRSPALDTSRVNAGPRITGSRRSSPDTEDPLTTKELLKAADRIHEWCDELGLNIICLQPFMNYEGLRSNIDHSRRIEKLRIWIQLAHALGTDLVLIPSNFLPADQCTGDKDKIVSDMREVAQLGQGSTPCVRFAYESLCWGTHHDTWEQSWETVKAVNMPNFGLCLDTFNIAGRVFADPTQSSGKTLNAERDLEQSMSRLRRDINAEKVFLVQLVDAERLDRPLNPDHQWHMEGQPPRMSWSRNARCFPFEEKGYLPVMAILKAILCIGYQGPISFELFSRTMNEAGSHVPISHAKRGMESWNKVCRELGWSVVGRTDDSAPKAVDTQYRSSSITGIKVVERAIVGSDSD